MMNNNFNNGATNNNNNSNNGGFIMTQGTITTIETFASVIKSAMEAHYGSNYKISINKVTKNNGLQLTGITILHADSNIAPNIYINNMFEQYQDGRTMESICREIINTYEEHKMDVTFDTKSLTDYTKFQNRICYKLVNANKNAALLEDAPHVLIEDLAVIFYILISNDRDGIKTITIKNNIFDSWDISIDELYDIAIANTQSIFRGSVQPMKNVLMDILSKEIDDEYATEFFDMMVDIDNDIPMYVCSNAKKVNGAGVILYSGLLKEFADKVDSNVYILPSSIHETLLIPESADIDVEQLKCMVRSVNTTEVAPDEILSDNVYYYNRLTDRVELA